MNDRRPPGRDRCPIYQSTPVVKEALVVMRPRDAAELDELELVAQWLRGAVLLADRHDMDRRPVGAA